MPTLSAIQTRFTDALLDIAAPTPNCIRGARRLRADARFGIYRERIADRLVGVLTQRFPVTRRMIGPESFSALARLYTIEHPPRSPVLLEFGALFSDLIRSLGTAPSLDYLADIAELEAARFRALHAADVTPSPIDLHALRQRDGLDHLTCLLHPSVNVVKSRFPVISLWEANLRNDHSPVLWKAEAALVARPDLDIEVWRLPAGGHSFVTALINGYDIAGAAKSAAALEPGFSLDANLDLLVQSNVCVSFTQEGRLAA